MPDNANSTDLAHAEILWNPQMPAELEACFAEGERLMGTVRGRLGGLGSGS
ncbi:MAG: hypothetical protein WC381_03990 [Kiritimatiellia bacterium]|jgi:hypothetical protein